MQWNCWFLNHSRLYQWLSESVRNGLYFLAEQKFKKNLGGDQPIIFNDSSQRWSVEFDSAMRDKIYNYYKDNLNEMCQLAQSKKVPVVLSTIAYNRLSGPWKVPGASPQYDKICQALLEKGLLAQAAQCFEKASLEDLQPHRSTKRINEIIKDIAHLNHVPVAPADEMLQSISKEHIPGGSEFFTNTVISMRKAIILLRRLFIRY